MKFWAHWNCAERTAQRFNIREEHRDLRGTRYFYIKDKEDSQWYNKAKRKFEELSKSGYPWSIFMKLKELGRKGD